MAVVVRQGGPLEPKERGERQQQKVYSRNLELDSPGVWETRLSCKSIAVLRTLPSTPLI